MSFLLIRCVNADPNYGSAWFHCREQPYDIPSSVLLNALHKLVHELVDTQALYARGLLHFIRRALLQSSWSAASDNGELRLAKNRSFVQDDCSPACSPARSSSAPPGRQREAKAGAGSGSDNGSSSRGKGGGGGVGGTGSRQKPPPLDLTKSLDGKLKARAQDKTAVSYGLTMMGGRRDDHHTLPPAPLSHRSEEASEEEVVQRDSELLSDFQKAGERLGASWPSFDEVELLPFVDTGKGALYCCTDFITGLVEMNRMMFNPNLSEETRRKNLFGSDQIVS